jgi:hypothetical protein
LVWIGIKRKEKKRREEKRKRREEKRREREEKRREEKRKRREEKNSTTYAKERKEEFHAFCGGGKKKHYFHI